jgi:hypothetical protein
VKRLFFVAFLAACSREPAPAPATPTPPAAAASPCAGLSLEGKPESYEETTNPSISGYDVGISNIFGRDLADDAGVVEKRLSASLSIHDPEADSLRHEIVVPGNVVNIGSDRYCVTALDYGSGNPGSVSLQKLAR